MSIKSWLFEHLLHISMIFLASMCVFTVNMTLYEIVWASSICLHAQVCVWECARMFFRAHYQSEADLSLLSANTQMFCHCPFSKSWPGICEDKQREQLTQLNQSVMSDGEKVILCETSTFIITGCFLFYSRNISLRDPKKTKDKFLIWHCKVIELLCNMFPATCFCLIFSNTLAVYLWII